MGTTYDAPRRFLPGRNAVVLPPDAVTDPAGPTSRRWRSLCLRLLLALVVAGLVLKPADWLLGWVADTERRHLLRLDGNAQWRHTSNEFDYVFRTNQLGLRGPARPFAKLVGRQRVVVIGDSFVAGVGVGEQDVFTSVLGQRWANSHIEVVNLGRAGTSTIRELTLYEELGRRFEPDVVVLVYYLGNDLAEVVEEQDAAEQVAWRPQGTLRRVVYAWCPNVYRELAIRKRLIRAETQMGNRTSEQIVARIRAEAVQVGVDPNLAEERYGSLPDKVRRMAREGQFPEYRYLQACLFPRRFQNSIDPADEFFQPAWARTERALDQLKQAVDSDGAQLMLVLVPEAIQVSAAAMDFNKDLGFVVDSHWLEEKSGRTAGALAVWARRAGVPLLEMLRPLRESPKPTYFVEDGHWTTVGHRVMAESLFQWKPLAQALAPAGKTR